MTIEENKKLVRRMLEWWPNGVAVIDETVAEDVVAHARGGKITGRDVFKKRLAGHVAFFTERDLRIEDMFAEGDRVAVRFVWSGVTAEGGRTVTLTNLAIYRIEGGRIAEVWEEQDTASLAKQTGMA
jgi:predicted ester cyclase